MSDLNTLVDAIIDGNTLEIENSFNAEMARRISDKLEDYRQSVAQSLFKQEVTTEDDN